MPQKRASPKTSGYVVRKRKKKLTRKSVLKMLAVMEASQNTAKPPDNRPPQTPEAEEASSQTFLQSGRTGRRNALANILGEHAMVTSSDLPTQLEGLTTKDKDENQQEQPSTSKS